MFHPCVREDPLKKGMATHPSILAQRIRRTEEPSELQSTGWMNAKFRCLVQNYVLKIFIGVQVIYSIVLVLGVQQSKSVIYVHISTLFQIFFPYKPIQSTEQSSLCCTVVSYQLSVLYIGVCMSIAISQFISPPPPTNPLSPGNHKFVFYICESCFVNKFICTFFPPSFRVF